MKCIKPIPQIQSELRQFFSQNGFMTTVSIAKACGMNQSQVHRNLYGKRCRVTQSLKALCDYANLSVYTASNDPRESVVLMEALGAIWDGSEKHAKRLAKLLFAHRDANL
ncbi:hypothetical protein [Pseudomonas syringae]|uniref:hypothetical protein n=2 Tax=Pseudomonas syringae TaxID=317 RepID=UPI000F407BAE|nr:hypothetical protein [Pseudomonas syringae]RMT37012.1 hypothetical protein ALP49_200074 [Pseudomonas syringae pv. solidagae]